MLQHVSAVSFNAEYSVIANLLSRLKCKTLTLNKKQRRQPIFATENAQKAYIKKGGIRFS